MLRSKNASHFSHPPATRFQSWRCPSMISAAGGRCIPGPPRALLATLLDCLESCPEFLQLDYHQIKMLVTLRLVVLEFPQPSENGGELFLVGVGQVIGWSVGLLLRHVAERIVERMELIVEIVQGIVETFAAFGGLRAGFHHISQIDHRFDAGRPFRLSSIVAGARPE